MCFFTWLLKYNSNELSHLNKKLILNDRRVSVPLYVYARKMYLLEVTFVFAPKRSSDHVAFLNSRISSSLPRSSKSYAFFLTYPNCAQFNMAVLKLLKYYDTQVGERTDVRRDYCADRFYEECLNFILFVCKCAHVILEFWNWYSSITPVYKSKIPDLEVTSLNCFQRFNSFHFKRVFSRHIFMYEAIFCTHIFFFALDPFKRTVHLTKYKTSANRRIRLARQNFSHFLLRSC